MPSASLTKPEYEVLAEIRYALRAFLHFSNAAAEKVGLSPQQYQALLAIKGFPGGDQITVGELAKRLQIKPHSAVGLVDRLAAEHLLARSQVADDRRKVCISLTESGQATLEKLASTHRDELRQLLPQLQMLLERINQH